MMFKLQFNLDNAAFGEDEATRAEEIRHILETASEPVQPGRDEVANLDSNGNRVGAWRITGRWCFWPTRNQPRAVCSYLRSSPNCGRCLWWRTATTRMRSERTR